MTVVSPHSQAMHIYMKFTNPVVTVPHRPRLDTQSEREPSATRYRALPYRRRRFRNRTRPPATQEAFYPRQCTRHSPHNSANLPCQGLPTPNQPSTPSHTYGMRLYPPAPAYVPRHLQAPPQDAHAERRRKPHTRHALAHDRNATRNNPHQPTSSTLPATLRVCA